MFHKENSYFPYYVLLLSFKLLHNTDFANTRGNNDRIREESSEYYDSFPTQSLLVFIQVTIQKRRIEGIIRTFAITMKIPAGFFSVICISIMKLLRL